MSTYLYYNYCLFQISENDGLPQKLCADCYERLALIKDFRISCEDSQEILRNIFKAEDQKPIANDNKTSIESANDCTSFEFVEYSSDEMKEEVDEMDEVELHSDTEPDCYSNDYEISNTDKISKTEEDENDDIESHSDDDELNQTEEAAQLECNICNKKYKREPHLNRHIATHNENTIEGVNRSTRKNPMHVCQKCGKRFSKLSSLNSHNDEGKCLSFEVFAV